MSEHTWSFGDIDSTVQMIRKARARRIHIFGGRNENFAAYLGVVGVKHMMMVSEHTWSLVREILRFE